MGISPGEESLISFYFRAGALFARSTFGAQLDRARNNQYGQAPSWAWRPPHSKGAEQPDPTLYVAKAHEATTGYEVEHEDLMRYSRASKRMDAVGRVDTLAYAVLAAFYGDRGARWAGVGAGHVDPETGVVVAKASGPGSIAALYPLTEAGRAMLQKERDIARRLRESPELVKGKRAKRAPEGPEAEIAARRSALAASLRKKRIELHALRPLALTAAAALAAVEQQAAAARGERGSVPRDLRLALTAARREARGALGRIELVRTEIAQLRTWFPAVGWRSPAVEPESGEAEGGAPILVDGQWRQDSTRSPTTALARLAPPLRRHDAPHLTDDELLSVVFALESEQPNQHRRVRLDRVRDQADALLVRAWGIWLATAPTGPASRPEPRNRTAVVHYLPSAPKATAVAS